MRGTLDDAYDIPAQRQDRERQPIIRSWPGTEESAISVRRNADNSMRNYGYAAGQSAQSRHLH
ncbi:hypothetical protein [Longispora fulva]|uniref:Uncharacterized protein n=1 Tax=Longispora fulva TaxID=619741 RepID=A0A8J7KIJ2_9ACTN|nr:hypothetical protein [Longispora fulva]MBG6136174.1 hypothetical protein [Longispora fulva]